MAIIGANLSTAIFGPEWSIVNAFLFIGFSLTTRDALHDAWHHKHLIIKMTILILAGSVISWLVDRSSGKIALASMAAFGISATVDGIAYHLARSLSRKVRINLSNIASAFIDSIIFPLIAFGGIMPLIMIGQFLAKICGGFMWSCVIVYLYKKKLCATGKKEAQS
jgi:uncharacterized PurR-regulated membrane protein YhhQ (DUF165 family)